MSISTEVPVKTRSHLLDFIKLYDHTYRTLPEATPSQRKCVSHLWRRG
jgi:hypothetical protein